MNMFNTWLNGIIALVAFFFMFFVIFSPIFLSIFFENPYWLLIYVLIFFTILPYQIGSDINNSDRTDGTKETSK